VPIGCVVIVAPASGLPSTVIVPETGAIDSDSPQPAHEIKTNARRRTQFIIQRSHKELKKSQRGKYKIEAGFTLVWLQQRMLFVRCCAFCGCLMRFDLVILRYSNWMISPPATVDMAPYKNMSIDSEINRQEPSHNATVNPPACKLPQDRLQGLSPKAPPTRKQRS
jgi:hypothetical protein